jgi:hypothetical protein
MSSVVHTDFSRAFRPGESFECPHRGRISVRQVQVARLVLPSGRIIACDPLFMQSRSDFQPYTRSVAPGRYSVFLSLATITCPKSTEERVACAMVRFKRTRARTWEMALLPGQDPAELRPGRFFGYSVDAGCGCFLDATAFEALEPERELWSRRVDQADFSRQGALEQLKTPFFRRLDTAWREGGSGWRWTDAVVDRDSGANLVAFTSGYGDGGYPSFWGRDQADDVSCLVTDFGILVVSLEGTLKFRLRDCPEQVFARPELERWGLLAVHVHKSPDGREVRLQLEGTDCFTQWPDLMKGRKHLRGPGLLRGGDRDSVYEYTLNEPWRGNAQLVVRYHQGTRAL